MMDRANGGRALRPAAPSESVSRRMRLVRRRNTSTEVRLRSTLHRIGMRYRVHASVPGVSRVTPDIIFIGAKVAVFVDGCFWHSCPIHGTLPKRNRAWWEQKLRDNVSRDRRQDRALEDAGWHVVRVWGHEDPGDAAERIRKAVEARRHTKSGTRVKRGDTADAY